MMTIRSFGRCMALAPLAMLAIASSAHAQQEPVARLVNVHGNVLVSKETGLASGADSTALTRGMRVITTANSQATVEYFKTAYPDGCEVALKPNQRFEISTDKPCPQQQARAESILAEPAGAIAAAGSTGAVAATSTIAVTSVALPVAVAAGGLAGLAALQNARESQAVSPH